MAPFAPRARNAAGGGAAKGRGKGVCFRLRDHNKCDVPNCPYDHDPAAIEAARKELGIEVYAFGGAKLGAGIRRFGKGEKPKGKDEGKGDSPDRPSSLGGRSFPYRLCNYVFNGTTCPYGDNCGFSHDASKTLLRLFKK